MNGKESRKPHLEECIFDRLSPLSDDVLHRILSFLDFLDVVRTCVLSKRWRNVWMSVQCLNFDMNWFTEHNCDYESEALEPRYKFWKFIKLVLLLRDESTIRRIRLSFDDTMIQQLNSLLHYAARKKVQELCFHVGDYTYEGLNFHSELCETLKSLTIEFRDNISLRVAKAFSSLKSLFLSGVVLSGDAAEKLFTGCVELEDLHLEDIQVKDVEIISISADKLKNLTILNIYRCGNYLVVSSFESKVNIRAPNLVSFLYLGPMLRGFVFLDTVSLKHVSIRILYIHHPYQKGWGRENLSPCASRFVGLNHTKRLTLSSLVVKYFSPTYFDPLGVTFILDNLNYLKLGLRCKVDCIEGLINLLKLSPNIEALAIRFSEVHQFSGIQWQPRRGGSWKSRVEDIACLSYHVKKIKISNYNSSKIAFQLVKFLLQNGKVLENMEIIRSSGEWKVKKITKLLALHRASSEVVVCFTDPASKPQDSYLFDGGNSDPGDD